MIHLPEINTGEQMESSNNTPSLYDVIKQFQKIRVDDYQRTYAWTRDEIGELFDDLKDCVEAKNYHFFGTLIFQSEDGIESRIVDGQQRLTTTFILMAALRDAINALGEGFDTLPRNDKRALPIPVINKAYEFLYYDNDPHQPRFESNRFLREILKRSVFEEASRQQAIKDRESTLTLAFRKGVKEVRRLLSEDLGKYESSESKLERINDLIDAIRQRFLVLRVMTTSLSESLEIFLTLNNRGLPLGPSDLVRGEIIAALSYGESEPAQAKLHQRVFEEWSDIADFVKEPEVFLRHFLVATSDSKVQKKKVYDTVSRRLKDPTPEGKKLKAIAFWDELQKAAEVYDQIISPAENAPGAYQLVMLHGLMKSHRILLMTVLKAEPSSTQFQEIAQNLYALCFRWVVSGGNAQKLEDYFQKWGNSLKESGDFKKLIEAMQDESDSISETVIESYFKDDADEGYIGRAVLHALNRQLSIKTNVAPLDSKIHLEHIAPQTETKGWKTALFSGNEDLYPHYSDVVSSIGNLTLLDFKINMSIKQADFSTKNQKYKDSSLRVTRDLLNLASWSETEVDLRTDYVIQAFKDIFCATGYDGDYVSFENWLRTKKQDTEERP